MGIFKRKPKFIYEISGGSYFEDTEFFDPYDLVEHIKNEDYRFRQDFIQETITISKIRNDKYNDVYYAKRINLPQEEDCDWLNELSGFFIKKPQDYLLEDLAENKPSNKHDESLTLEEFEAELLSEPEQKIDESVTTEEKPVEQEINELKNVPIAEENQFVKVSKEDFLSLKQEIADLKNRKVQEESSEKTFVEEQIESDLVKTLITTEKVVDPLSKNMDQLLESTYTDEIVQNVLRMTKNEMDKALSQFIASETTKIQTEIQQLDKRDLIEGVITKRIEDEETAQLSNLNIQVSSERDQEIRNENLRHDEKLKEIETTFSQQLNEKTTMIQEALKEKLETSIKEEYEQQTEQLSRILQGKMDELKLRQQAVNAGLEANFKEALENFNREHKQVIQDVEQKKQRSPINLEEIRKLKHA